MDSSPPENKKQTRSITRRMNVRIAGDKIPLSNKSKKGLKMRKGSRKAGAIIYIGHIPHGFYEDEMKSYFNQFGEVLATTVARSKKTGRSRGFGFVEFKDEEVAKIAAETMNNYLMFNKILKCRYIPPEEQKGRIVERKVLSYDFPRQRNQKINQQQKEKAMANLTQEAYLEKAQAKIAQFKKFFEEKGFQFNFKLDSKGTVSSKATKASKTKAASKPVSKSESKKGADDEFGVLEIDESENEISFTTPPQVKKVIKKSLSSNATPVKQTKKLEAGKQKISQLQLSKFNETQKKGKVNKIAGKKLAQKKERTLKAKEFLVKDISSVKKGRKGNMMGSVSVPTIKREKLTPDETGSTNVPRSSRNKIKISIKAAT